MPYCLEVNFPFPHNPKSSAARGQFVSLLEIHFYILSWLYIDLSHSFTWKGYINICQYYDNYSSWRQYCHMFSSFKPVHNLDYISVVILCFRSAVHRLTGLCDSTLTLLHEARDGAKKQRKKVEFKAWNTGLAHRWRGVCCFGPSIRTVHPPPWVQHKFLLAISQQITPALGAPAHLNPVAFSDPLTPLDSSNQFLLNFWLHSYIYRDKSFWLPGFGPFKDWP